MDEVVKICKKHGELHLNQVYYDKKSKYFICKLCHKVSQKKWGVKNTTRHKRYRKENKDKIALKTRHYREINKEKISIKDRKYWEKNKNELTDKYLKNIFKIKKNIFESFSNDFLELLRTNLKLKRLLKSNKENINNE